MVKLCLKNKRASRVNNIWATLGSPRAGAGDCWRFCKYKVLEEDESCLGEMFGLVVVKFSEDWMEILVQHSDMLVTLKVPVI